MRAVMLGSVMLLLALLPAFGQEAATPADLFAAKQYAGYLTRLPEVLRGPKIELMTLLSVAVALDKTGYHDDVVRRVETLLEPDPAAWQALCAMAHDLFVEMAAQRDAFICPDKTAHLPYTFWRDGAALLREHGYPALADQAAVIMIARADLPVTPETRPLLLDGLQAALRVPRGDAWLGRVLLEIPAKVRRRRQREIGDLALDKCIRPTPPAQPTDPAPKDYYAFALRFGEGFPEVYADWAARLWQAGKRPEAVDCATLAGRRAGDNRPRLLAACRQLEDFGRPDLERELLESTLRVRAVPFDRDLHLAYLGLLARQQRTEPLEQLAAGVDPLTAADALMVLGNPNEAAATYRAVMAAPEAPLQSRLSAWDGLLRLVSAEGLAATAPLLREIERLDVRAPLARWAADRLCAAAWRSLPLRDPVPAHPWEAGLPALTAAPGWAAQVTGTLDRLLALEPAALLLPDPARLPASLRLPMATVHAAARQPQRALAVLTQRVDGSIVDADTLTESTVTYPAPGETEDRMLALLTFLSAAQETAEPLLLLAEPMAAHFAARITAVEDEEALNRSAQGLAETARLALAAAERAGTPEWVPQTAGMLEKSFRTAFGTAQHAQKAVSVLRDGLRPAVLNAQDAEARAAAFGLLLATLVAYRTGVGAGVAAGEAEFQAKVLEATKRAELQPLARRLRQEFPQ